MVEETVRYAWPVRFGGSIVLLIIALFLWPPLGILVACKDGYFVNKDVKYRLKYHGKWFWLFFWAILFFPITFVLVLLNGFDVVRSEA